MNIFDKICAGLAFVLGAILIVLGVVGLFTGCKAHFVLPPVLGAIPALLGWGIVKPVIVAWRSPRRPNAFNDGRSITKEAHESNGNDVSGFKEF